MAGFTASEWISFTPNEVFDFITLPENAPKVMESVQNLVPITDGPLGVGTRYRETRLMHGCGLEEGRRRPPAEGEEGARDLSGRPWAGRGASRQ